ncbi:MAG: hypothetical protein WCJ58_00310 [bacterium]
MLKRFNAYLTWLDENEDHRSVRLINQIFPVITCLILFIVFMFFSIIFIKFLMNPFASDPIELKLHFSSMAVGFFLYFVTAVDYALIVGRMQAANPGIKARFAMNVFTCIGCFIGVTVVLFLWGFAKEVSWLILPLLIFAGSVMIKLAYEGRGYFEKSKSVPFFIRIPLARLLKIFFYFSKPLTFWIPELGSPNVQKMRIRNLAKWAFLLPFIIGLDDFVGYMGAMTIYNVFSLLFGIYLADIVIDLLIFISPKFTKKVVQSALLSLLAAFAFLYLAYKSYSESYHLLHEKFNLETTTIILGALGFFTIVTIVDLLTLIVRRKAGHSKKSE